MIRVVIGLIAGVILAGFVVVLASGFGRDPGAINSPLVNHHAPGFTLRTLDNHRVSLASLRGRPVVVNFWASWCVSCKTEHDYLLQAYHQYTRDGVAFVGIDYQDNSNDAERFLRQYGGGWPVLKDPEQETAINYGVYGVPETFFIDRKGVIRYKSTGPVTPDLLVSDINQLLKEPA